MRTALFFTFLLASSFVSGAPIITTTLVCDGHSCEGQAPVFIASVEVGTRGLGVKAYAEYNGDDIFREAPFVQARIMLEDDFIFTLHGGTGIGRFTPCGYTSPNFGLEQVVARTASYDFGPIHTGNIGDECYRQDPYFPIAYDIPTVFHLVLYASANVYPLKPNSFVNATAFASVGGFFLLPGDTYTLIEAPDSPEPASLVLCGLGLLGLVIARLRYAGGSMGR